MRQSMILSLIWAGAYQQLLPLLLLSLDPSNINIFLLLSLSLLVHWLEFDLCRVKVGQLPHRDVITLTPANTLLLYVRCWNFHHKLSVDVYTIKSKRWSMFAFAGYIGFLQSHLNLTFADRCYFKKISNVVYYIGLLCFLKYKIMHVHCFVGVRLSP